jgi:alkaline phosphatase D
MPQTFWDTILLASNTPYPDLFIYTGDNVYGDCSSEKCTELRMAYYNLSLHPSIQGAASQIPIIATLDDHDYGMNNCHAHNPYKDTAKDLFQEFFNYSWNGLPWHEGVYQSYAFGKEKKRIQIILLDTRYGRSPFQETNNASSPYRPKEMDDMDQHMLTEFQWQWLRQQINNEPNVVVRIIISSIQVLNDVTGFEAWRHLPMEQQRLFDLLQNEPVIFISGDRHVGGIYEMTKSSSTFSSTNHKFVEITASSLTHSIPFGAYDTCTNSEECDEAVGTTRVSGPLVRDNHYGTISIDYDTSQITIALRRAESSVGSTYRHTAGDPNPTIPLHGDAGDVLIQKMYAFSEL